MGGVCLTFAPKSPRLPVLWEDSTFGLYFHLAGCLPPLLILFLVLKTFLEQLGPMWFGNIATYISYQNYQSNSESFFSL